MTDIKTPQQRKYLLTILALKPKTRIDSMSISAIENLEAQVKELRGWIENCSQYYGVGCEKIMKDDVTELLKKTEGV